MSFIRVALDVPLPTLFDYRAAAATRNDIGARVLVPFGKTIAVGVIVELAATTALPPQRVRSVLSILRDVPPLPPDILGLLKFCSDYYLHPLGEVVLNALPTRLRQRQALKAETASRYRLTGAGLAIDAATLPRRATIKLELLRLLRAAASSIDDSTLRAVAPRAGAALKTLIEHGWIERVTVAREPPQAGAAALRVISGPELTDEQRAAVDTLRRAHAGFAPWLLHGVTGSGKTEVYLQLITDTLASGKQALLLVPEINLTD